MRLFCGRLFFLLSLLGINSPLYADYLDNPAPIPGWTHSEVLPKDTPEQHGIILNGGDVTYSAPVIGEVDGNLANGREVVVGGADGILHAYRADGTPLWNKALPNASCSQASSNNKLLSSPSVGELFGDGVPYVVVGYGGVGGRKCDGGLVAIRGSDGATQWEFSLRKFAKKEKFGTLSYTVFSSPTLADVDGNGTLEIGFGSFDRNVYLLNSNGSVRWYYNAADTIWSSPVFLDVTGDGDPEMIIGTDISGNLKIKPPTKNGGYLYAFKTAPRNPKRIQFRDKKAFIWQTHFDQVIYSSPVVADVIPESPGEEIIVGSGCYFPEKTDRKKGNWFKILKPLNGKVIKTLTTQACSSSAAAAADIDDDGIKEVIVTVNGSTNVGGDGFSRVTAWKASSGQEMWSIIPRVRGRNDDYGGNFISPVIADVDGNGSLEVIVANGSGVGIFKGIDGTPLTCQDSACEGGQTTLYAWDSLRSTPVVGDINTDGVLDIIAAGGHTSSGGRGMLYGWTNLSLKVTSDPGLQPPYSVPWPMYRGGSK